MEIVARHSPAESLAMGSFFRDKLIERDLYHAVFQSTDGWAEFEKIFGVVVVVVVRVGS